MLDNKKRIIVAGVCMGLSDRSEPTKKKDFLEVVKATKCLKKSKNMLTPIPLFRSGIKRQEEEEEVEDREGKRN